MEFTPRVQPDAQSALIQWNDGTNSPYVELYGSVSFRMDEPDDVALLTAGEGKRVYYSVPTNLGILPGVNSISVSHFLSDGWNLTGLYDKCYELRVTAGSEPQQVPLLGQYNPPLLTCWHWDGGLFDFGGPFSAITECEGKEQQLFAYDGPPVDMIMTLRPGMLSGITPANAFVYITLVIRLYIGRQATAARVHMPSPSCMPPFMVGDGANDGTWLFSAHPTKYMPTLQPGPWPRVFQSKPMVNALVHNGVTNVNAVCLGGPWKFHATGHTLGNAPRNDATFSLSEAIMGAKVGNYDENVLDTATDSMATLDSRHVVNGAHIKAATDAVLDSSTTMEILAYYP